MKIRVARAAEQKAVAAFCRRLDADDYVPGWMGEFTAHGRFYLLLDGAKIAGMVHGRKAPDGSAWLSAARVDPDYRGQGWINRLNDFALASPDLKGAHAARMLITQDNASSLRAADKGGYHVATRFSFVEWEAAGRVTRPRGRPSGYVRCTREDFRLYASMSPVPAGQAGLAYMSFAGAFELTDAAVEASRPWQYRSMAAGPLLAQVFTNGGERWMAAEPLVATGAVAGHLLDFALENRVDSLTAILPDVEHFVRPFLEAGYERSDWATHVNILEKRLPRRRAATSSVRRRAAP